jgi:hypothetical protein
MLLEVWNAQVLLRELQKRNYAGGYTILKDWLHPESGTRGGGATLRNATRQAGAVGLGTSGNLGV